MPLENLTDFELILSYKLDSPNSVHDIPYRHDSGTLLVWVDNVGCGGMLG